MKAKQFIENAAEEYVSKKDALEALSMQNNEVVNKWTKWCFNYPTPFEKTIGKIWGGTIRGFGSSYRCEDNHFTQHLIEKWQSVRHNDAHMMYFYCELDTAMQQQLVEWVMNNYEG